MANGEDMENRFNLIEEKWIPIVDVGKASLRDVFTENYRALGGNPVQKIALTKLLLAIAQAASTPADNEQWAKLGPQGLAANCLTYMDKWQDRFYLYGDKPFLQMPAIKAAKIQSFGAVLPEIATGNTTRLTQIQIEKKLDDADKALLIVTLMGFALGGKKTDNSVVLSSDYRGKTKDNSKPTTGKAASAIGFMGYLHNFLQGSSLIESLWLNLLTDENIKSLRSYEEGLGIPPWEEMPAGEDCPIARRLKKSLQGRLIPLSRFCLLGEEGLHYSEGIAHPGHADYMTDPSVACDFAEKKPKAIWADPEKRPWRSLTSILAFIENNQNSLCPQITLGWERARKSRQDFGIWSGGLRVSSNAGEQYVSGSDDFVESCVLLPADIQGKDWFANLKQEMGELDKLSKIVYASIGGYFKSQNMLAAGHQASASNLFWQLCEPEFQNLIDACNDASHLKMRNKFAAIVNRVYDQFCPQGTARQLDAWAKNRPNLSSYLKGSSQDKEAAK